MLLRVYMGPANSTTAGPIANFNISILQFRPKKVFFSDRAIRLNCASMTGRQTHRQEYRAIRLNCASMTGRQTHRQERSAIRLNPTSMTGVQRHRHKRTFDGRALGNKASGTQSRTVKSEHAEKVSVNCAFEPTR
ncbi:uncharacterized protein LOC127749930 isoform X2 [Frankliniella occidentalis]|uniref:Uncharacterized protein LOC127749930 isoform X2 n=1 Tax=Frankliniella occidentalis TaxID=133901 RepID=A0A9C6UEL4_FRAOC|nr:uncharacterized protein LOC127749930 isoform X2 [Frankliniella occidentalis]